MKSQSAVDNDKLKDYKPLSRNPNKHTQRGLRALQDSIREIGYTEPMVSAADGTILSGNARLESVAEIMNVDPIIVESDGTRPIIHKRTDIANADTEAGHKIVVSSNRIAELDLSWDVEVLAGFDADVLGDLWTPEELSDLGQQWVDVLGKDDLVDKDDRAGSSPWDRVEASDKVRCLIGDIEFGVAKDVYQSWLEHIQTDGIPREVAEQWFSQHLP